MTNAISVITEPTSITEFDDLPKRIYSHDMPYMKQGFKVPEKWYIESGNISFTDECTNNTMTAKMGNIIVLPKDSKFSKAHFSEDTTVQKYIDDADERNRISTNIKINYLIIKTILEVSSLYDDFVSVPYKGLNFFFEGTEEGNLYKYTNNWQTIDTVIQNFADRTGISENVWYGEKRLRTGLRFNKPDWDSSLSIDFIDNISDGTKQRQREQFNLIKNDPLDLISQDELKVEKQSLYTLNNLITFVARDIKEQEKDLLKNVFPSNITLPQPRDSSTYVNKKGLPPYLLYGNELATVIKHLFWSTSVGFDNREKLI